MRRWLLTLALLLLMPALASAATYYVRTDGNNANWPCTVNTAAGACLTIDYVADRVAEGDTVRVQAGTYAESVTPSVSGTEGNPVTFVADGVVVVCQWQIASRSYLRIVGFTIDANAGGCAYSTCVNASGTNDHLEFWHNTFRDATNYGYNNGTNDRTNNSLFIGNTFTELGNGSSASVSFSGEHNLVAYNDSSNHYPDFYGIRGNYHRLLNNRTRAPSEVYGGHSDVIQTGSNAMGFAYNLFEGLYCESAPGNTNEHITQISNAVAGGGAMTENLFRRNLWHEGSGNAISVNQASAGAITYTRLYHNTSADMQVADATSYAVQYFYHPNIDYTYLLNNIEYESWGASRTTGIIVYCISNATGDCILGDRTYVVDYNLGYDTGGAVTFAAPFSTQTHGLLNVNPGFTDYAGDDFSITNAGSAYGNAGPLTVTSGSGTGTTFNVAASAGGFFRGDDSALNQYGGALVVGDTITVGTDVVAITSIAGDALTVTPSFTWANGESVYFGSDTTPDIGAYPYKAGGYTLSATYASAGGTTTITPNDASLVRFAVCYSDGVPVTVANSSPYTCPTPSGTMAVRVYPLYASKVLWADATGVAPAAPTNVRIR